jgi:hypothetical protein
LNQLPDQPAAAPPAASQVPVASSADHGLVLYTGNSITAEELEQFIDCAAREFFGQGASVKSPVGNGTSPGGYLTSASVTLTPLNFAVSGFHGIAYYSQVYESARDVLVFGPAIHERMKNDQSYLTLWVDINRANPGTLYTILFRVYAHSPKPSFEIIFNGPEQTVRGNEGTNQFAYSFTCTNSDAALIAIYCSVDWSFNSAMLMTSNV